MPFTSGNMGPQFAANDTANGHVRNAHLGRDRLLHPAVSDLLSDVANGVRCQASHMIGFAFGMKQLRVRSRRWATAHLGMTVLCDHIQNVVQWGAKEQMVWSNTGRVVAMMQNPQARWNHSKVEFPREPVSVNYTAIIPKDCSVPLAANGRCPDPASISLIDLGPESFGCRARHGPLTITTHRSFNSFVAKPSDAPTSRGPCARTLYLE